MEFKILFCGDGGVGKSSFIRKHMTGEFVKQYLPTLGVEVHPLFFNGIKLNVWDLSGQEKFSGKRNDYMVGAKAAILFYDSTSKVTFKNLNFWRSVIPENIPILYVRTKCDIENINPDIGIPISSRRGENIDLPLQTICDMLTRSFL